VASYRMTPARRAALRRAQLASAAKRRGRHNVNTFHARLVRNQSVQRAGFNQRKRSAAYRQFQADVNKSRVTVLGKKSRSQRNQNIRRVSRTVGRHTVIAANTAFLAAALYPNSKAGKVANKGFDKAFNTANRGARSARGYAKAARAAPSYARGFHSGFKTGMANHRAAQRNLRHVDMTHVKSERVGPLAITAGTGARQFHGRRVRGY